MISTATTFIVTIMSLYGYCHLILQREQYFENTTWIHLGWLMLYISSTFMVIHCCSSLTNEVRIHMIIQIELKLKYWFKSPFLFEFSGKTNIPYSVWHYQLQQRFRCDSNGIECGFMIFIRDYSIYSLSFFPNSWVICHIKLNIVTQ